MRLELIMTDHTERAASDAPFSVSLPAVYIVMAVFFLVQHTASLAVIGNPSSSSQD